MCYGSTPFRSSYAHFTWIQCQVGKAALEMGRAGVAVQIVADRTSIPPSHKPQRKQIEYVPLRNSRLIKKFLSFQAHRCRVAGRARFPGGSPTRGAFSSKANVDWAISLAKRASSTIEKWLYQTGGNQAGLLHLRSRFEK